MQSKMVDYGHEIFVDILQMGAHDIIDDIEIDILILVDKNIPEADHGYHFLCQPCLYDPLLLKDVKDLIQASRNTPPLVRDNVTSEIDASLNSQLEVVQDDILNIEVVFEGL